MRITGNKPITGVKGRSPASRSASGGNSFVPDMNEGVAQSGGTHGGSSIQGMDALLALQEVDERQERRQKAARRAHSLLDRLEEIRADLLAGQVSEMRLESLARLVTERPPSGDPAVESVIDEIELRVKVELAKLGRFHD